MNLHWFCARNLVSLRYFSAVCCKDFGTADLLRASEIQNICNRIRINLHTLHWRSGLPCGKRFVIRQNCQGIGGVASSECLRCIISRIVNDGCRQCQTVHVIGCIWCRALPFDIRTAYDERGHAVKAGLKAKGMHRWGIRKERNLVYYVNVCGPFHLKVK